MDMPRDSQLRVTFANITLDREPFTRYCMCAPHVFYPLRQQSERLKAYCAYLTLKPIETVMRRRDLARMEER